MRFFFKENDIGLIAPFLQLPSTEEYPDYYESVEQPIDMSMIKDKLDKGQVNSKQNLRFSHLFIQYKREQDLVDDLNRMFSNAKLYNVDESYIFKYACQLERVLADKYKNLITKKEKLIQNLISNRPINHNITKK